MIWQRKTKTAEEFVAELNADSGFVSRREEFEAKHKHSTDQHDLAARPVLQELKQAGFAFESLDQLRHCGLAYRGAIPILLKWLPLVSDTSVKESRTPDIGPCENVRFFPQEPRMA